MKIMINYPIPPMYTNKNVGMTSKTMAYSDAILSKLKLIVATAPTITVAATVILVIIDITQNITCVFLSNRACTICRKVRAPGA